jgi:hypothetical protein
LINGILFRQNFDDVLMRCLEKDEAEKVLLELHAGEAGGHFGGDTTAHKVLRASYYWPHFLEMPMPCVVNVLSVRKHQGGYKNQPFLCNSFQ